MIDEQVMTLIRQGQEAAQRGNNARAREFLRAAVDLDPNNAVGWLWLSGVVEEPEEAMRALERVLELDPNNQRAQQGLLQMRARFGQQAALVPMADAELEPIPQSGPRESAALSIEQELRAALRVEEADPPKTRPFALPGGSGAPGMGGRARVFVTWFRADDGDMTYRVAVAALTMTLVIGMLCFLLALLGVGPGAPGV